MDECTKAILEFSQNPEPYFDYISYSGKGINELGYYDYCLRNSSNSYFLVNMNFPKAPSEVVTFIGLCFKQSCSSAQIEYFIPLAASIYNITLDGVQFSAKKSNGDEGDASINHSTYITIAIVLLILALGLIHPIVNLLKSMRENKKMPDGNANNIEEDVSVLTEDSKISMPLILKNNQQRPSRLMEFFKCFAADLNLKRLFSVREGPLDFFNGIRALSLLLVILGHDYYLRSGMSQNPEYILKFIRTPFYLVVGLAFYAVDVFFWLSGFFLAFVLLDPATKK